jgi:uncharacterized protein
MFKNKIIASALLVASMFSNNMKAGHLYRVTSKEGKEVSYIFGTIHMVPKDQLKLTQMTERVLMTSRLLVTEVDLTNIEEMKEAAPKMMIPDGQRIEDVIGEERVKELEGMMEKKYKVTKEEFAQMKQMLPIFWAKIVMEKTMPELGQGYDFLLTEKAKELKIKTEGLSTMSEELESVNKIEVKSQLEYFMKSSENIDAMKKEMMILFSAYREGDDQRLYQLIKKGLQEMPGANEHLLVERNKKWAEKLKETLRKGNCLVAVGAAHLIGKESLLNMLENNGYRVEKVEESGEGRR